MIFGIIFALFFLTFHTYRGHFELLLADIIGTLIGLSFLWVAGTQYDRAKFFSEELKKKKEDLRHIFDNVDAALWSVDLRTKTITLSEVFQNIYGHLGGGLDKVLTIWKKWTHPDDREIIDKVVNQIKSGLHPAKIYKYRIIQPDGQIRWLQNSITPITDPSGRTVKINGVVVDITEQQQAEETIKYMAYHDELTGLPNRSFLRDYFKELIYKAKKNDLIIAIIFIDLDRFKVVNDTLGHDTGDLLLYQVATRLRSCVRKTDVIARQGGDEFIILLDHGISKEGIELIASRVLRILSYPFNLLEREVYITPSIGISLYPQDGLEAEDLIKHADTAMYDAKSKGKNNYQFYSPRIDENNIRKVNLEIGLRKALEKQEFQLLYQPKIKAHTGDIMGFEALIRWNNPESGIVSPAEFIPIAEETDLIISIGDWVLREACKQNQAWQDAGYPAVGMCVNISARQLREKCFITTVRSILQETNLQPQYLELEITESLAQFNIEESIEVLNALKSLGISLALDDFGKGFSSLSYLVQLPVDVVKIDKSFVQDFNKYEHSKDVVKAIIQVSHSLNKLVVAEGVETKEQLAFLRLQQCDAVQGYYFSRPLPADQAEDFLKDYIIRKS